MQYNLLTKLIGPTSNNTLTGPAARFVFAATLLIYFWQSATTKLAGLFTPSDGAYAQIFPRAFEAAGYDSSQFGLWHWAIAMAGSYAEYILPALIVLSLFTRLSALGMIGFVIVQTATDLWGHGAIQETKTLGRWFENVPDSVILDQRLFWVFLLLMLVLHGGGRLSLDRVLTRQPQSA